MNLRLESGRPKTAAQPTTIHRSIQTAAAIAAAAAIFTAAFIIAALGEQ